MKQLNELDRSTKYVVAVVSFMKSVGHATNADILRVLRNDNPSLSATTVHRVTSRLSERGILRLAPSHKDNVLRYDANKEPHDHFMCIQCGMLRDAQFSEAVRPMIEEAVGDGCSISGSITVTGVCKKCKKEE